MKGEELADGAEDQPLPEFTFGKTPLPVVYNPKLPPEFFDLVIIDECHRSIYNVWRQGRDAFYISEYTHEKAVARIALLAHRHGRARAGPH